MNEEVDAYELNDDELDDLDRELALERGVVLPTDEEVWSARDKFNKKHFRLNDQRDARRRERYRLRNLTLKNMSKDNSDL